MLLGGTSIDEDKHMERSEVDVETSELASGWQAEDHSCHGLKVAWNLGNGGIYHSGAFGQSWLHSSFLRQNRISRENLMRVVNGI